MVRRLLSIETSVSSFHILKRKLVLHNVDPTLNNLSFLRLHSQHSAKPGGYVTSNQQNDHIFQMSVHTTVVIPSSRRSVELSVVQVVQGLCQLHHGTLTRRLMQLVVF